MSSNRLLICSVTDVGEGLVCACNHCGWLSPPVDSGTACGALWDQHMSQAHDARFASA